MKKFGLITIGLVLFSWQLFAQEIKKEKQPDEQITVNKKYDENGNLVQYDSTYVHQWSSDSTFHFSFPDDKFFSGHDFPDLNEFLKNYSGDSIMGEFDLPDSLTIGNLPSDSDSLMEHFNYDSKGNLPLGFAFRDFEEFEKQLNEQLKKYPLPDFQMPQFKNDEQRKEWEDLMKKYQKEIDSLRKKWNQEDSEE